MKKNDAAFTLVELLVVVGLIAILTAMISAAIWKIRLNAMTNRTLADLQSMAVAIRNYRAEYEYWPGGNTTEGLTENRLWANTNPNALDNNKHLVKFLVSSNPLPPYDVLNERFRAFWEAPGGDLQFIDSWRTPIAILIDVTNNTISLTSAGPDRNLNTTWDNIKYESQ